MTRSEEAVAAKSPARARACRHRTLQPPRPSPYVLELGCRGRRTALPDRPGHGSQGRPDAGAGLRAADARAARGPDGSGEDPIHGPAAVPGGDLPDPLLHRRNGLGRDAPPDLAPLGHPETVVSLGRTDLRPRVR